MVTVLQWVFLVAGVTHCAVLVNGWGSGCVDKGRDGVQNKKHPRIAACSGPWVGHIQNASSLCAPGWRVCSWYDQSLLKSITWKDATSLSGCFAFNAAQDSGQCRQCKSHLEQDDLAGIGRGCPHQSFGQNSCISGGKMDASCCVDTHFKRACLYRPGLATGVLCCKLPSVPPRIMVQPEAMTHAAAGVTFVLSCQATGTPTPTVFWYKDGRQLARNFSRISVLDSGYLLVSQARPSDSGHYSCFVMNAVGNDSAVAVVHVTDHSSGCADGVTEGLHQYPDVQACGGAWRGHVKRGRSLCARGWHVCNPRHMKFLQLLTWSDVSQLDGCYAYNAANYMEQCTRCFRHNMAGVGKDCGRLHKSHRSCLGQGRIDVFDGRSVAGCHYQRGYTTGALCCRKLSKVHHPRRCHPECANGGLCTERGRCHCAPGYKGAWCQNAICPGGCIPNSHCVRPGVCRCRYGYTGPKCKKRHHQCRVPCHNGGRCRQGKCKCPVTHRGSFCQYVVRWRHLTGINHTNR